MEVSSKLLSFVTTGSHNPEELKQQHYLWVNHTSDVDHSVVYYPPNLTKLVFSYTKFEPNPTNKIILPDTVKILRLNTNYPLSLIVLPKFLEELSFGPGFNQDIRNAKLPETITHLYFGRSFNQPIKNANFPVCLKTLELGDSFNQDVVDANLPEGLITLKLGPKFNHPLKNANLPKTLKTLYVDGDFNYDVEDANFPESLEELYLNAEFSKPIANLSKTIRVIFYR